MNQASENRYHCLITVGTTQFPDLIKTIDDNASDLIKVLQNKGIDSLTIQFGRGEYVPKKIAEVGKSANITVEVMRYTRDNKHFQDLLHKSVLVISHAGAGCILETLHKKKPLFVVVNERLMNNHQVEIAKPLAKAQYLYYSNVSKFISTLDKCDITKLKPYPQPNYFAFSNLVNQEMGI